MASAGKKSPIQLPMDSREGSIVSLSQRHAFVNGVLDICSHIFGKLLIAGPIIVANARF